MWFGQTHIAALARRAGGDAIELLSGYFHAQREYLAVAFNQLVLKGPKTAQSIKLTRALCCCYGNPIQLGASCCGITLGLFEGLENYSSTKRLLILTYD